MEKKKINKILCIIFIILGFVAGFIWANITTVSNNKNTDEDNSLIENFLENEEKELKENNNRLEVSVLPTMKDTLTDNSAWCATFQLVWNDMQDNIVGGDINFNEENIFADNLNVQSFKEKDISEEYYYKNWGIMSTKLKAEIEDRIKNKFNETSDILDSFDWPNEEKASDSRYFFYAMLKREFEFQNEFKVLENKNFANTENVEYFGIDKETEEVVRNQVEVLYYNSEDDFAVILNTKENDQVVLVRNPEGKNFEEILNNTNDKATQFEGIRSFTKQDTLAVPNINMDLLKEYTELQGKVFALKDGNSAIIDKAIQTIKMELNNKGGKIKSEAGMAVMKSMIEPEVEPRNFDYNDEFVIFLKESDKDLPYFAAKITDINLFKK